jgi:diguanylate cyclase (GGDEF)-like protein/PAS domain S-box-containing protein
MSGRVLHRFPKRHSAATGPKTLNAKTKRLVTRAELPPAASESPDTAIDDAGPSSLPPPEGSGKREQASTRQSTALLVAALILPLALAGYGIFKDHAIALSREMDNSRDLADSVQVYVTETLNQTAVGLRAIEHDLEAQKDVTTEKQLAALHEAMRYDPTSWVIGVRGATGIVMVDTDGARLNMPDLQKEVSEVLAQPGESGLSVLPAIYSKEYLDWYLPVRLRYVRADGQDETAFALVAATKLIRTAANAHTIAGGFFIFVTPAGVRLFKYLDAEQEIQVSAAPLATVTQELLRRGGSGNFESISVLTQEALRVGYSTSDRFPIAVLVAVPALVSEATWLRRSAVQIGLALLAVLAVGFFAFRLNAASGALGRSQTLYRDLFESAGEGLLVLDSRGEVQTCNPGAVRILGASSTEALKGCNLMSLTAEDPAVGRTQVHGISLLKNLQAGQRLSADWRFSKTNRRSDVDVEMRLSAFPEGSLPLVTVLLRDVGAERKHLRRQEYMASHDGLTGLLNRYSFQSFVHDRIEAAVAQPFGVVLMDLNRFKEINDTLGHHAGDIVLRELGKRLQTFFAKGPGFVARLGGDEISVCAPLADGAEGLENLCSILQGIVGQPISVDGVPLELKASLGGAIYPDDAKTPSDLLRCADIAMYAAKREVRSHQRYHAALDNFSSESLALQADFARALRENGLSLVYQPKVDMVSGALVGVEALSRWEHPTLGPVPPSTFVPLAETTELIHPFTEYVLREALAQSKRWLDGGHCVPVSVNISTHNLMNANFIEMIRGLLELHEIPSSQLELEVTESALMRNPETALQRMQGLRALGVKLSIDDFGTGYASLAYLKRLPVDVLKIDKSFTRALAADEGDRRIVRSTIDLAHGFGMCVVAEGVETLEVAEILRRKGCDIAQGYLYAMPLSPAEFTDQWLTVRRDEGQGNAGHRSSLEEKSGRSHQT